MLLQLLAAAVSPGASVVFVMMSWAFCTQPWMNVMILHVVARMQVSDERASCCWSGRHNNKKRGTFSRAMRRVIRIRPIQQPDRHATIVPRRGRHRGLPRALS